MPPETNTGPERRIRVAEGLCIETRAGAEGQPEEKDILGHAVVWDEWTTIYDGRYLKVREIIRPGAFTDALAEGQDVRSLWNHDPNYILGRTTAGTLTLEQDDIGLLSRTNPPKTQTIRDLVLEPIARRDVTGMSFGFTVRNGDTETITQDEKSGRVTIERAGERITQYDDGGTTIVEREILSANLFDTSPVTFPAYTGTDVALRSSGIPGELRQLIADLDAPPAPKPAPAPLREKFRQYLDGK